MTDDLTPLDMAHQTMAADSGDDTARLGFYARLADAELLLLLTEEPQDNSLNPQMFDVEEGAFVLAFDREERLAAFAEAVVPYAALSGRALAGMLAGQNIGLGLNLGVAESSILIPADAMQWLATTVAHAPDQVETRIDELRAPTGLPENLLVALDTKLATASGLAACAYLAAVTYQGGGQGHLLAVIDPTSGAEGALAKAVSEALTFSGLEAGALDVGFFSASDQMSGRLARVGLRFDLPQPKPAQPITPTAPGSDPAKPPRLR
jgi:hypothetical protein